MPKHIELTNDPQVPDLLVDAAMLAVWHGMDDEADALIAWMRHRTDNGADLAWLDAFRCLGKKEFAQAEHLLRGLIAKNPQHTPAVALLANVLHAAGKPGVRELIEQVQLHPDAESTGALDLVTQLREVGAAAQKVPVSHLQMIG